jgi:hypothetical protein
MRETVVSNLLGRCYASEDHIGMHFSAPSSSTSHSSVDAESDGGWLLTFPPLGSAAAEYGIYSVSGGNDTAKELNGNKHSSNPYGNGSLQDGGRGDSLSSRMNQSQQQQQSIKKANHRKAIAAAASARLKNTRTQMQVPYRRYSYYINENTNAIILSHLLHWHSQNEIHCK